VQTGGSASRNKTAHRMGCPESSWLALLPATSYDALQIILGERFKIWRSEGGGRLTSKWSSPLKMEGNKQTNKQRRINKDRKKNKGNKEKGNERSKERRRNEDRRK
jgi:hypothetical protein